MPHVDEDGARSIDVLCTCCSSVIRIRLDPDVHGREKAAQRAEIVRLHGRADTLEENARIDRASYNTARTRDADNFADAIQRVMKDGADIRQTFYDTLIELALARGQIASLLRGHHPADLARAEEAEARAAEAEKKNDYYESANCRGGMPSLYEAESKKFDKDLKESCGRPVPAPAPGPPMGHAGCSHTQKPEMTVVCPLSKCGYADCGASFAGMPTWFASKTFIGCGRADCCGQGGEGGGEGGDRRSRCTQLLIEKGRCPLCGRVSRSPVAPDVEGTWYCPVILSRLLVAYVILATDRKLSGYSDCLLGIPGAASTILNGRKAAARLLEPCMSHFEALIKKAGRAHFDESPFSTMGRRGYVWIATVACAAVIAVRTSRSADVFKEEFAFAVGMIGTVDGYGVYPLVLDKVQRCWRHVLNNLKKAAIRDKSTVTNAVYGDLCGIFERIKGMESATADECIALLEIILEAARRLPVDHPSRTEIINAGASLLRFLLHPGMDPTNNPGESDLRCGPILQRNVRHQLRTLEGMKIFAILISFYLTCTKQGIPMDEAFLAIVRGADPADIFKADRVAPNRWGGAGKPKRPGRGPLDGLPPSKRTAAGAGGGAEMAEARAEAAAAAESRVEEVAEAARAAEAKIREAARAAENGDAKAAARAAENGDAKAAARAAENGDAKAAARAAEAAAAEAAAAEAAAAESRVREAAAAEAAAAEVKIREAAAAESRVREAAAAESRVREAVEAAAAESRVREAVEAAAAEAKIREAVAIAIAMQFQKALASHAMSRVAEDALHRRGRKAVLPTATDPPIPLRTDTYTLTSQLRHAPLPASARLRRPPKPPPPSMRPRSLPEKRRRRPGNGHVPIKPSVPPP